MLSLGTAERSLAPSLYPPSKYLYTLIRLPLETWRPGRFSGPQFSPSNWRKNIRYHHIKGGTLFPIDWLIKFPLNSTINSGFTRHQGPWIPIEIWKPWEHEWDTVLKQASSYELKEVSKKPKKDETEQLFFTISPFDIIQATWIPVFQSLNQSLTGAGIGPQLLNSKIKNVTCSVMQERLTRKLLWSLWRKEVSFGKGSFILNRIQHIKVCEKSEKLVLAFFFFFKLKLRNLKLKQFALYLWLSFSKIIRINLPQLCELTSLGIRQVTHFTPYFNPTLKPPIIQNQEHNYHFKKQ